MKTLLWILAIVLVILLVPAQAWNEVDSLTGFPMLTPAHNVLASIVGYDTSSINTRQFMQQFQQAGQQLWQRPADQNSGGFQQPNISQQPMPQGGGRVELFIKATHAIPGYTGWAYAFCTKNSGCLNGGQSYSTEMGALASAPSGYKRGFMISSSSDLQYALSRYGDDMRRYGVTWIGYDAELSVGTTPTELSSAYSADFNSNDVAKAASMARDAGYGFIYGARRQDMDGFIRNSQPIPAVSLLVQSGLTGIALQDQKPIATQSAKQRYDAALYTINAFRTVGPNLHVTIQLMDGIDRCGFSTTKCAEYVRLFSTIPNTSLGVWPTGSDMSSFVRAINP